MSNLSKYHIRFVFSWRENIFVDFQSALKQSALSHRKLYELYLDRRAYFVHIPKSDKQEYKKKI